MQINKSNFLLKNHYCSILRVMNWNWRFSIQLRRLRSNLHLGFIFQNDLHTSNICETFYVLITDIEKNRNFFPSWLSFLFLIINFCSHNFLQFLVAIGKFWIAWCKWNPFVFMDYSVSQFCLVYIMMWKWFFSFKGVTKLQKVNNVE